MRSHYFYLPATWQPTEFYQNHISVEVVVQGCCKSNCATSAQFGYFQFAVAGAVCSLGSWRPSVLTFHEVLTHWSYDHLSTHSCYQGQGVQNLLQLSYGLMRGFVFVCFFYVFVLLWNCFSACWMLFVLYVCFEMYPYHWPLWHSPDLPHLC